MKIHTPEEAVLLLRPDDRLATPLGPGQPAAFLHALATRDDWTDLEIFSALLVDLFPIFVKPGVTLRSGFFGPVERGLLAGGYRVHFVPADFRRFSAIARRAAPRVCTTAASPPDAEGYCSLSLHAGATVDELHRCGADPERLLVVEANPKMPRTLGLMPEHPHRLHVDEIDVLIESEAAVRELPDIDPSDVERAIAECVASYVPDGATLQTGIGGIPNAVVSLLAQGSGGDYGVHSEMFTDGLMHLHEAGKVTNQKGLYDGISVSTFAMGTRALYDWLDGQELVRFLPVEAVNTPSLIAANREMISINGALAIDLHGQVMADSLDGKQFSGIGGHEDFVSGAAFADEGRSLVCLPSTAGHGDARVSRIVDAFPAGALITTPRHQVDVIVTEFGAAELAGKSVEERRQALVRIAHPDFRGELEKAG